MKLLRLQLDNRFRSLPAGFELIFRENDDNLYDNLDEPICLVGVNGSGKSNVLEALAEIFSYLDQTILSYVNGHSDSPLINSFEIEYLMQQTWDMNFIAEYLEMPSEQEFIHIKILKKEDRKPSFFWILNGVEIVVSINYETVLPKRIIGYSSGQNELLSIPFNRIKFRYYSTLLQEQKLPYRETFEYSRLRYIDYDENANIILSNYLMAKSDEIDVLKEHLFIQKITAFDLIINKNQKKAGVLNIEKDINKLLDFLEINATDSIMLEEGITKYKFIVTPELKTNFQNNYLDSMGLYRLFKAISFLNLNSIPKPKIDSLLSSNGEIYDDYKIADFSSENKLFHISEIFVQKIYDPAPVSYRKLSDGEHQFIHVIGTLLIMKEETGLFLFDEPETHFNPQWKYEYTQIFKKVTNSHKSQILMTTHDPVLLSGLAKENVIVFNRPQDGVERTYKPDKDLRGMGVDAILTSEIFGLNSTLDSKTLNEMIERRKLMVKKEKGKLTFDENAELTNLSDKLMDIDFNKPFADPLYKDFIMAIEDLDVYKETQLSATEIKERENVAKQIIKKLNQNGF